MSFHCHPLSTFFPTAGRSVTFPSEEYGPNCDDTAISNNLLLSHKITYSPRDSALSTYYDRQLQQRNPYLSGVGSTNGSPQHLLQNEQVSCGVGAPTIFYRPLRSIPSGESDLHQSSIGPISLRADPLTKNEVVGEDEEAMFCNLENQCYKDFCQLYPTGTDTHMQRLSAAHSCSQRECQHSTPESEIWIRRPLSNEQQHFATQVTSRTTSLLLLFSLPLSIILVISKVVLRHCNICVCCLRKGRRWAHLPAYSSSMLWRTEVGGLHGTRWYGGLWTGECGVKSRIHDVCKSKTDADPGALWLITNLKVESFEVGYQNDGERYAEKMMFISMTNRQVCNLVIIFDSTILYTFFITIGLVVTPRHKAAPPPISAPHIRECRELTAVTVWRRLRQMASYIQSRALAAPLVVSFLVISEFFVFCPLWHRWPITVISVVLGNRHVPKSMGKTAKWRRETPKQRSEIWQHTPLCNAHPMEAIGLGPLWARLSRSTCKRVLH